MKAIFLIMSFSCMMNQHLDTPDFAKISEAVYAFCEGADHRDVDRLDGVLHANYRAIVNQAFGANEVQLMDKPMYLDLIKKKVIGGDTREVTILSIDVEDKIAVVKAKFAGKQLNFTTFIQVVHDVDGEWRVMSDMPVIEKVTQ